MKNCAGIKGGALFTDFVKAYDTLSHDYIISRFYEFGGSDWSSMIALVIGGSSKVWISGSLGDSFSILRGVRQGDVILPIIFNLCINPLLLILNIPGVTVRNQLFKVLAYADDLVFFVNNVHELKRIKILLAEFKLKSGLTVSLTKSKFMPFVAGCTQNYFPSVLFRHTYEQLRCIQKKLQTVIQFLLAITPSEDDKLLRFIDANLLYAGRHCSHNYSFCH